MKSAAHNKNIIGVALIIFLLLLISFNSEIKVKVPDITNQVDPPLNFIKLDSTERTIINNVYLNGENLKGLNEPELFAKVRNYAISIDTLASDATLDTSWKVVECKVGKKVNVEKTLEQILNAPDGGTVVPVIEDVQPSVTTQNLLDNIVVIGDYSTPLLDRSSSRVNNIKIASQKLDYLILLPGKEFSFNGTLGRRTEAKGYKPAPIIINIKEKGLGVGGGICQVSSTLYNAINNCGLQILERHSHTLNVGYVPKGRDATVSYGAADFRFKNTRKYPIMFRTYLSNKSLTIKIIENRNQ